VSCVVPAGGIGVEDEAAWAGAENRISPTLCQVKDTTERSRLSQPPFFDMG